MRAPAFLEGRNSLLQIDGIPEDDRGNNQIDPLALFCRSSRSRIADRAATRLCSNRDEPDAGF